MTPKGFRFSLSWLELLLNCIGADLELNSFHILKKLSPCVRKNLMVRGWDRNRKPIILKFIPNYSTEMGTMLYSQIYLLR